MRCAVVALSILLTAGTCWAQGTAFNYQGQLKDNGSPANGNYPVTFRLFSAPSGAGQVGSDLVHPGLSVTNGLFSTTLDFGVTPWTPNAARWLEIVVNGQTLSPRQSVLPVPFALNTRGIHVDSTGRVGIGTASPAQKLSVVGTIQSTSGGFVFPDGTTQTTAATGGAGFWSASGANIYKNNTGNVGIGTSTPASLLDVRGWLTLETGSNAVLYTGTGTTELNRYLNLFNSPGLTSASGLKAGGVLVADSYAYANPGKSDLVVKGKVAIGTGTPSTFAPLTISTQLAEFGWVHTDSTRQLASYVSPEGGWLGTRSNHPLHFYTNDSVSLMTLNTAGNLGIGTTTPITKLDVNGAAIVRGNSLYLRNPSSPSTRQTWGMVVTTFDGAFNLGRATDTPSIGSLTTIPFRCATTAPDGLVALGANGVGINTLSPQRSLDVNGIARVKVLEITGADLAEKFPTRDEKPEPGTVMEIDPDHAGELRTARGAYSPRVAGVVSGAGDLPVGAVLGNLPGSDEHPAVALSGRVWVRCHAAHDAIQPGDLLTTADTPGHAMKASDRERSHGAILGKAMTALGRGETALVLVLVNLQ